MQLIVPKKSLLAAATRCKSVAAAGQANMPILAGALLVATREGSLRLSATDLYQSVDSGVDGATVKGDGDIAVPAKFLFDIVRALPEGDVTLRAKDQAAPLEISAGKANFRIPGMDAKDFPELPEPPASGELSALNAGKLAELLRLVGYAMSDDDTRPQLNGALLERAGDALRMVATDGHRLAKAEIGEWVVPGEEAPRAPEWSILIPAKGVTELRRLADSVDASEAIELLSDESSVYFRHGGVLLSVKLSTDEFPPYGKVIPDNNSERVEVAREPLVEALKRVSLVNGKNGAVRLALDSGTLCLSSEDPEVGEGSEEVAVDYAGEGLEIAFSAKYMIDALTPHKCDRMVLELGGPLDPVVVRPMYAEGSGVADSLAVVMPMRI